MSDETPAAPVVVRTIAALRAHIGAWRDCGETIAFIPTMGALHDGHLALVRAGRGVALRTCVSLFVNPTQFGPHEDFTVYPRDESGDRDKLAVAGTDLIFAPGVDEMYPEGSVSRVVVPGLGDVLEGEYRPGFFAGVATVVTKLLIQVMPDTAVFGEKDYQQVQVVRRVVSDLCLPVTITAVPTVREADGLAMSSRNAYLSAAEREVAPALFRVLTTVAADVAAGAAIDERCARGSEELLAHRFHSVDYLTVRDAETLMPWINRHRPARVLAAARLGRTRLIDNVAVPVSDAG